MSSLALALLVFAAAPGTDVCEEVFDRTPECAALDAEGLADARVDAPRPAARLTKNEREARDLSGRLVAAAAATATLGVASSAASFAYTAHLEGLRQAGTLGPRLRDEIVVVRTVLDLSSATIFLGATLLGGTAAAFWVFDPSRGAVRPAFRIEE
jgi:hypothetical protein